MEKKQPGMQDRSRFENQRAAQEEKKLLIARLLSRQKKTSAPVVQGPGGEAPPAGAVALPAEAPAAQKATEIPPVFGHAAVSLRRGTDDTACKASRALARLVDIVLFVAQTRERVVVLQWPGAITVLAVVHALATMERWAQGDKLGLRTAIYPAKANVFFPLNHIWLNRGDVLRWANELIENPGQPNARVTRPLPDKDAFLYSLASLGRYGAEELHPTAGELLPHFTSSSTFSEWESCESQLLQNVAARLRRKQRAALKREQCAAMGCPSGAPDAVFALNYGLSKEGLQQALVALRKAGPPEVILIDASRQSRLSAGKDWADSFAYFVRLVHEVFKSSRPGLVLFADEPQVAEHLRHVCRRECRDLPKEVRALTENSFRVLALPCAHTKDGLIAADAVEFTAPTPRTISVRATDADAARVINTLQRYAGQVPGGRANAVEVTDAASFLHRLSALPSSIRHLMDWVEEVGNDPRLRDRFTWVHYSGRLREFISKVGRGEDADGLERALQTADQIWTNYQTGTAFAEQLASAVGAAASSPKRIAVVFDRPLRRRLAERFLEDYSGYPNGKRLSDFKDRVRLILASELAENLESRWATRYVFAGLDGQTLRLLVTDDRLPQDTLVLLTQRSAQYLHGVLRRVLQYSEFNIYKPRIESMERQLASFAALDDKLILRLGELALPDFDYQAVLDGARNRDEAAEGAFEVTLEGGRRIYRRKGSEVFLYDPTHQHATERGFRRILLDSLRPGDRLFDMSAELREHVESVLKEAGVPIQRDKRFEASLHNYHRVVSQAVAANFPDGTIAAKARALRERMVAENPAVQDWPTEAAVRHWISLGHDPNIPFENLQPQAPQRREHYFALCKALRLNDVMSQYFLYQVILPIRNARRLDGRYVSDTYSHMLLEPESVLVHTKIKRTAIEDLFARAMDNIYVVEAIKPPREIGKEREHG